MIKDTKGFIAISSVLILSAIFLSITISMASRAITVSDASMAFRERDIARFQAHSCEEHALNELERTLDYQGNEVILIGDGSCEILNIEGSGNTNRIVRVQSIVGSHTYRIEDTIEQVSPHMVIASSELMTQFEI
jgi:hypothetical protein